MRSVIKLQTPVVCTGLSMHSVTTSKGPAVAVTIFEQIGTITIDVLPVELYATQRFDNLDAVYFLNTAQRNYIKKHNVEYQITQSAKEYYYDILIFVRTTDERVVTLGKLLFNG